MEEKQCHTLNIRLIRVINKACLFIIIIIINVDDLCSVGSLVVSMDWLHEFSGILNDGIKHDFCKWVRWHGITAGGLPQVVSLKPVWHGDSLPVERLIVWEYGLAFASTDWQNSQHLSGNQNEGSFHLKNNQNNFVGTVCSTYWCGSHA